jgi:FMN phosphatase YigB (HAD superfamily)
MKNMEKHKIVGWDMDGTLYDHPLSEVFSEFIRVNPYNQEFHVVTFRSHGYERYIDCDLRSLDLDRSYFAGVHNVDDQTYHNYEVARKIGRNQEAIDAYMTWKGKICHDVGATLLLDDMTDLVIRGCDKYGIEHIHPDDLRDWREASAK